MFHFRGTVALRPGGCGGHAQQQCGEQASYESGGLGFVYPLGAMQIVGKVEYHLFYSFQRNKFVETMKM